jgi:hypothetical protein
MFICGSEKSYVPPTPGKTVSHLVTASVLAGRRASVTVFKSIYQTDKKPRLSRE